MPLHNIASLDIAQTGKLDSIFVFSSTSGRLPDKVGPETLTDGAGPKIRARCTHNQLAVS